VEVGGRCTDDDGPLHQPLLSLDVVGGEVVATMVHNLIGAGGVIGNLYPPPFMRVTYGGVTPEAAIVQVEL
jgi:hypothetical protein